MAAASAVGRVGRGPVGGRGKEKEEEDDAEEEADEEDAVGVAPAEASGVLAEDTAEAEDDGAEEGSEEVAARAGKEEEDEDEDEEKKGSAAVSADGNGSSSSTAPNLSAKVLRRMRTCSAVSGARPASTRGAFSSGSQRASKVAHGSADAASAAVKFSQTKSAK